MYGQAEQQQQQRRRIDWLPIPISGMRGDPSVINPAETDAWYIRDCELYYGKLRPRIEDRYSLPQDVNPTSPEFVHGVYWIPHPIDYPLIRAWLYDGTQSLIGEKGLFYTPHMTAGYFLLNKNMHLVVRFMGYLTQDISASSTGVWTATDPTEFYSWMKTGYLQIVDGDIDNGYRCEIIRYTDGLIDENRLFKFTVQERGAKGTTAKPFAQGARVYSCFFASYLPAPEILSVSTDGEKYAVETDTPITDFAPTVADINRGWDKPVFVAPTISLQNQADSAFPPAAGATPFFGRNFMHGIAIHGKTDTDLPEWCYGKFPPRLDHNDDNNYYNTHNDRKYRNRLLNNWDVYDSDGYAYWRSLWVYRSVDDYSQWNSVGGRFNTYWYVSDSKYIPQVEMLTANFAGRAGLGIFIMYPGDADYYQFVYRVLKHPFKSAADADNYARWNFNGGVMVFPRIVVFGIPTELENDPKMILRFFAYHGATIPSSFLATIAPRVTTRPDYAEPQITPTKSFLQHRLAGARTELPWSYEAVRFRRYHKRMGELNAAHVWHSMAEFRNVTVELKSVSDVYAFAIHAFLNGTTREDGSAWIDSVHGRAYANGDVVTHNGIMLLWDDVDSTPKRFWELPAKYLDPTDNRQVCVFSPRYSGSVRGRIRAYSAILWRGASASRAANVYVHTFSEDWNSPRVQIKIPFAVEPNDILVLYEMTGTPRAVGVHTFTTAQPPNTVVEIDDTDARYDFPFVWATEPLPYGPAVSYENRLLVLDQSVWCSAVSDYPQFTAYPRQKGDGIRVLLSSPVDRLVLLENQAIVLGARGGYRIVLGELLGDAVPFPVSVTSDVPLAKHARLQDYNSYATRRGLIYNDKIVYLLPEDWIDDAQLAQAYVVQSPYGPILIRSYKGATSVVRVSVPAVATEGYTEYIVEPTTPTADIVDVQWYNGLRIFFNEPRIIDGRAYYAISVALGTERVSTAFYEMGALRIPQGLRPRMIELYGRFSQSSPITVRYYEQRDPDAEPTVYADLVVEEPFRAYSFDLSLWSRKFKQLQLRFLLGKDSELESGSVRIVGEVEP